MLVKNNLDALKVNNTLARNSNKMEKELKKVSSGMKINGAADDASGYAISERMRTQIRSLDQANANTQNATSLMKVAEGAVNSTIDILRTMKEKAINAANDSNTDSDRQTIQKEFDQMIDQIDDNANVTYNGKTLVDGSHNNKLEATATILANDYLEEPDSSTLPTNGRLLTDFKDSNGQSLGIQESDNITISIVQDGKTYTKTYGVKDNALAHLVNNDFQNDIKKDGFQSTMSFLDSQEYYGTDGFGNEVASPSGRKTTVITCFTDFGVEYQYGGIMFSITDSKGNVKTSANAVLNQFHEVLRAQDASEDNAFVFQVGAKANQSIKVGFTDMRAYALALKSKAGQTINIGSQANANAAIEVLDNALSKVLDQQTNIGAVQSRLAYTSENLTTASTNVQASESVVRDADMAKEMTEFTKSNILTQAAQSMLAQANQQSSGVLSLLQ